MPVGATPSSAASLRMLSASTPPSSIMRRAVSMTRSRVMPGLDRRLHLVLVAPPASGADLLGIGAQADVLAEVGRRRADAAGNRLESVEVEAVAPRRGETEQLAGVLHRHGGEVASQAGHGVGPRALGVWVVGAPHGDVATDDVAAADLLLRHRRRADEYVGAEVVGRELGD